jgi:hypothetical protein
VHFSDLESPEITETGTGWKDSKDPGHKNEESIGSKAHRARYLRQRAMRWGHLHSGGEVAHRLTLRRMRMRTRITHRKGWSESIGRVIYSKMKSMLENK